MLLLLCLKFLVDVTRASLFSKLSSCKGLVSEVHPSPLISIGYHSVANAFLNYRSIEIFVVMLRKTCLEQQIKKNFARFFDDFVILKIISGQFRKSLSVFIVVRLAIKWLERSPLEFDSSVWVGLDNCVIEKVSVVLKARIFVMETSLLVRSFTGSTINIKIDMRSRPNISIPHSFREHFVCTERISRKFTAAFRAVRTFNR